jgi:hypothetical protein
MTCETVRLPGGGRAIVCNRGRRRRYPEMQRDRVPGDGGAAMRLLRLLTGQTCDRYLCRQHAVARGPGVDWCPDHPRR